jgi:hypothetical protein
VEWNKEHEEIVKLRERAATLEANRVNDQEAIKILREGKQDNTAMWISILALISVAIVGGLGLILTAISIVWQVKGH